MNYPRITPPSRPRPPVLSMLDELLRNDVDWARRRLELLAAAVDEAPSSVCPTCCRTDGIAHFSGCPCAPWNRERRRARAVRPEWPERESERPPKWLRSGVAVLASFLGFALALVAFASMTGGRP